MVSFGMIAALAALGIGSGAGSGWFFSRRYKRQMNAALKLATDNIGRAVQGLVVETQGVINSELDDLDSLVQESVQQQVSLAMSEVLGAMAAAEQQKVQLAQAQAQAAELERLRSIAQRAQQQPPQVPQVQITDALAEMNERMNAMAGRMRQAGVNPSPQ